MGKTTILVIVDRLSKFAHFIALTHPFTAKGVAVAFIENVHKLYCMPKVIVCDRDVVFTSEFGKEVWSLQGSPLHFSTSFPQTDGQIEVVNRCLETSLSVFALTSLMTVQAASLGIILVQHQLAQLC